MTAKTIREKMELRLAGMKGERGPYEPDWDEIARLAMPSRRDILAGGKKSKRRANTATQDTAGRLAGRKLINGMSTGLSSSSRPWFILATPDRDMMEYQPVKEWLHKVQTSIYGLFAETNYYDATKLSYAELGHMGVAATVAVEHHEYGVVWHALTAGEYWIELDDGLRVSGLARRYYPTVDQLVSSVNGDWNKLSRAVKQAYEKNNHMVRVPCIHFIEANNDRFGDSLGVTNKPWRSVKWEEGQDDKNVLLSVGGYDSKPFTAPRWETISDQVYCDSSPAFDALPDLRELQLAARRNSRAMDMLVKPPMRAASGLAQTGLNLDPGSITYMDAMTGQSDPVSPIIRPDYNALNAIQVRQDWLTDRVNQLFYADLFMAISDMEGVQPRNEQELLYRNEEKLTQLGPVVDRVNIEKLEVDIDRAYTILENQGRLPPPPPELEGKALTVDFVSILAQAQKAANNTSIERAARFVGFVGGMFPDAVIKFDAEQAIDEFANNSGTSPKIIRSDEMVAQMREQMQQQKAAEQAAAMAPTIKAGAETAELLSRTQVDPGGNSMLNRMLNV